MMDSTKPKKFEGEADNMSFVGGGEAPYVVNALKRDLEGWREVLIPMEKILKWEKPYHPAIVLGSTTLIFGLIWCCDISALTTISLIGLLLGVLDFSIPYFGPTVSGYTPWTVKEEHQFTCICETIASFRNEVYDSLNSLVSMRHENSTMFFIIVMGIFSFTAWLGNIVNNLLLTYLIVSAVLCYPGLQHNDVTSLYMQRGTKVLHRVQAMLLKSKEKAY